MLSMLSPEEVRARIVAALPGAHVEVTDLTGTPTTTRRSSWRRSSPGARASSNTSSSTARSARSVGGEIHALALKTMTPDAWEPRHEEMEELNERRNDDPER